MNWVPLSVVRARWPGAPTDDVLLQAWVDDAETIIASEFEWIGPALEGQPGGAGLDVDALQRQLNLVVTRMVIRVLSTPFGVRSEAVGDTSMGYADNGGLYLTDADRELLSGWGPQSAFTIDGLPASYRVDPTLLGAWVNGPDGTAPREVDPFAMPAPANPDPAVPAYPSRQVAP